MFPLRRYLTFSNHVYLILHPELKPIFNRKSRFFWDTFFKMFLYILGMLPFIERTQKDSCISLKKGAQENVRFAHDLVTFS